ncbi:MAG: endonuclease V [Planctomycetes bacterium]|nr:endonuclease V [Planctomycetota bacterium]
MRFPVVPDLTSCLRQLLAQVPAGRVSTCGDLARALGNRIAAKWVGHFALHHEHDEACTCHRILRAGGSLGGYIEGSTEAKAGRLETEGIEVRQEGVDRPSSVNTLGATAGLSSSARNTVGQANRGTRHFSSVGSVVDLERFGFRDFASDRPLIRLREIQEDIQSKIVLRPRRRIPKFVGGVDVSYPTPETGVAAYALVETATGRLVWSTTVRRRVAFPYISTYLSFREVPILLELLDAVRAAGRLAEVLLVDGSGVLHQRHAGVASHLGVVASLPTVGVTKKLLFGQVDIEGMSPGESRPVTLARSASEGTQSVPSLALWASVTGVVGVALRTTAGSQRPIFISPGHRVDVDFCERLVRRLLTGRRLPEPLYWADRISRTEGKATADERR